MVPLSALTAPEPVTATDTGWVIGANVAVMFSVPPTVNVHSVPDSVVHPVHPVNSWWASGVAVSVTTVSSS